MAYESAIYRTLPHNSHTIRLLDVHPGRWDDNIACTLRETLIRKARGLYTTISYTWGSIDTGTRQCFVTVNLEKIAISENLYTILRRLRRPNEAITVWCDALCINQASPNERTHQVGLMGKIYRLSRETVIWLGDQTDRDDVGQRFLGSCMTGADYNVVQKGGPPKLSWHNDELCRRFLTAYTIDCMETTSCSPPTSPVPLKPPASRGDRRVMDGTHIRIAADSAIPRLPEPFQTLQGRSFDVFGAFCLIYCMARGDLSVAIRFLRAADGDVPRDSNSFMERLDGDILFPLGQAGTKSARVRAALEMLISRSWWSRIWVIQETVLARKATVHYGMLSVPWQMLADAAAKFMQQRHALCLDLSGELRESEILSRFSTTVLRIDKTRQYLRQDRRDATLLSLLWKFRSLESTDKRDKVFALIGLTTDWQGEDPFQPDYVPDVASTFTRTAIDSIRRSVSLTVMAGELHTAFGRKRCPGLPSWVIDWSLPCLQTENDRVVSLEMYDACGGQAGAIRYHSSHGILEAEGMEIDTVVAHGSISRHKQINDTLTVIREWNFMARHAASIHYRYPTGCTYHSAFWRTLLCDIVHTGHLSDTNADLPYRRASNTDFTAFEAWRMWSRCISRDTLGRATSFTQRDLDEGISSVHYALKTATGSRTFFLTRKGYMGIGPQGTKIGDRLIVLKGSKVPFLVRAIDGARDCKGAMCMILVDGNGERPKKAETHACEDAQHSCDELVGDCFAYGLMDGEAFKGEGGARRMFLV